MYTIGIDARIYKTGIGRVVENLLSSLESQLPPNVKLVVFLRKDGYDSYQPQSKNIAKVLANFAPYSFAEQIKLPFLIRKYDIDLMHFTNFNAPIFYFGPFILTMYDLIHLTSSTFGNTTKYYVYYLFKKLVYRVVIMILAQRAKFITTISEVSRSEIMKRLYVSSKKVIVTSVGFDHVERVSAIPGNEAQEILSSYGIKKPFMLYVATMYPHKNHKTLLVALSELIKNGENITLVLVGKVDSLSARVRSMVLEMGLSAQVVFPNYKVPDGYLPDSELHVLYQNAKMVVFPSLTEGFGIPVLEAQWYGKPILASDLPIFHEVGGQGVVFFDPHNASDIAQKIKQVLDNDPSVTEVLAFGHKNVKRFLWRDVAQKTLFVYKTLLYSKNPTS